VTTVSLRDAGCSGAFGRSKSSASPRTRGPSRWRGALENGAPMRRGLG
jgi:hypothetical protein